MSRLCSLTAGAALATIAVMFCLAGFADARVKPSGPALPGDLSLYAGMKTAVREQVNGWIFAPGTGLYGTGYLQRALITAIGLGANRPQDAIYPTSETDAAGKPCDGAHQHVRHLPQGQMPPAKAFWSLTM